ncbi:hypothetical protein J7E62_27475 [Variovorax paradoxus]|nr:hypothetical protein [Variovorax paradoxus]
MTSRPMPLTPRTSRDVCRDAIAIEFHGPRKSLGHRIFVPACTLIGIATAVILYFTRYAP